MDADIRRVARETTWRFYVFGMCLLTAVPLVGGIILTALGLRVYYLIAPPFLYTFGGLMSSFALLLAVWARSRHHPWTTGLAALAVACYAAGLLWGLPVLKHLVNASAMLTLVAGWRHLAQAMRAEKQLRTDQ